jgi:hypothetical protein
LADATIFGEPGEPPRGTIEVRQKGHLQLQEISINELLAFADKSAVEAIDFSHTMVDDDSIKSFNRFENVRSLNLRRTWITDSAFETISQMSELRDLDVSETRVSDDGIKLIVMCSLLSRLNLENTNVEGRAFEKLADLTALVDLDISRHDGDTRWNGRFDNWKGLSDEGFELVSRLTWLDRLNIDGQSNLSPSGLRYLLRFSMATEIGIDGLPIDPKLKSELHQSLPNVTWEYRTDYRFMD